MAAPNVNRMPKGSIFSTAMYATTNGISVPRSPNAPAHSIRSKRLPGPGPLGSVAGRGGFMPGGARASLACGEARNDAGHDVLLNDHDHDQHQGQNDAVNERPCQNRSLFALQVRDAYSGGDVLRRDHLAEDAARRIGGGEEQWIQLQLPSGDDLQIAEQRIARGIAAGQEHRNPSQEG